MLPGDVRTLIEKVDKKTNNTGGKTGGKTSVVSTTSDKVWLPSAVEVYGDLATFGQEHPSIAAYPAVLNAEGSQYELFSGNAVKPAGSSLCKKTYKAESGTEEHFWRLRSAHADDAELALIVDKSGAWYSYNEERLGQGRDNVKQYLLDNPDFMKEVEDKVREHNAQLAEQAKAAYRGGQMKDAPVAEEAPAPERKATTAASAKAKLDITVDDDE
jgi:hypothetical protein